MGFYPNNKKRPYLSVTSLPLKEIYTAIAIALTFIAFASYIRAVKKAETKPHVFSWVIWGLTTVLVFFAQLSDGGGLGAWPTGVGGAIACYIAVLAYLKKGDITITRTDWAFFISALIAILLWLFTSEPLWAVIILTTIDILGFFPTIRKTYFAPHSENLTMYGLILVRNILSILALETLSATTLLFPGLTGLVSLGFILMVIWKRHDIKTRYD